MSIWKWYYYPVLNGLWREWQLKHDIETPEDLKGRAQDGSLAQRRFLAELQKKHYDEMRDYARSLGLRIPICGSNWTLVPTDTWSFRDMDFLSQHSYYDGPGTGQCMTNNSVMKAGPFASLMGIALEGKPIVSSEWNFVYPTRWRCEGFPWMSAMAAFQDWDALLFYGASGSITGGRWSVFERNPIIWIHSQQLDPASWGFSQAAALLFRRGDVRPAKHNITLTVKESDIFAFRDVSDDFQFLASMAGVRTRILSEGEIARWPLTETDAKALYVEAREKFGIREATCAALESDTGELKRFSNPGLFLVDSPNSKMVAGAFGSLGAEKRKLEGIALESTHPFAAIAFSSLDGKPLGESARFLITLAADARPTGAMFKDGENCLNWGRPPVLAEPVTVKVSMKSTNAPLKVFALNPQTGARMSEISVHSKNHIDAFELSGQSIYFEALR